MKSLIVFTFAMFVTIPSAFPQGSAGDVDNRLKTIRAERSDSEAESSKTSAAQARERKNLADKQQALETEISALLYSRKQAERSIAQKSFEIEAFKIDVSRLEIRRDEAASKTQEIKSEERRIREEWAEVKDRLDEQRKLNSTANSGHVEAKRGHESAALELHNLKSDLAKATRGHQESLKRNEIEIVRLVKGIQAAHKARIAAESEQVRLDTEASKTREYLAQLKESNFLATDKAHQSESSIWKATLSVESARRELSQSVGSRVHGTSSVPAAMPAPVTVARDKASPPHRTPNSEAPLAPHRSSWVGQPDPPSITRPWITETSCSLYEKPNKAMKQVGVITKGQQLTGRILKSGWAKVQSPSGETVYVDGHCGRYRD